MSAIETLKDRTNPERKGLIIQFHKLGHLVEAHSSYTGNVFHIGDTFPALKGHDFQLDRLVRLQLGRTLEELTVIGLGELALMVMNNRKSIIALRKSLEYSEFARAIHRTRQFEGSRI